MAGRACGSAAWLMLATLLPMGGVATDAEPEIPTKVCKNEQTKCSFGNETLKAGEKAIYCVQNPPMLSTELAMGKVAQLLDAQTIRVVGAHPVDHVALRVISEDRWLSDLTPGIGLTEPPTVENRTRDLLLAGDVFGDLRDTMLGALWVHANATESRHKVSPFYKSCLGIKAKRDLDNITIDFRREVVLEWKRGEAFSFDAMLSRCYATLLVVVGLALFFYADTLAESVRCCGCSARETSRACARRSLRVTDATPRVLCRRSSSTTPPASRYSCSSPC